MTVPDIVLPQHPMMALPELLTDFCNPCAIGTSSLHATLGVFVGFSLYTDTNFSKLGATNTRFRMSFGCPDSSTRHEDVANPRSVQGSSAAVVHIY